MPTVDLSERDNKETLFVKEEVTNDAEVYGEVEVDDVSYICLPINLLTFLLTAEEGLKS